MRDNGTEECMPTMSEVSTIIRPQPRKATMLLYSDNYEPDDYEGDQDLSEYEDDWSTVESELFGDC
jgi:hypothetical protein